MLSLILLLAAPQAAEAGVCAAAPAEVLVGEQYRRHVRTRAKRLSGASVVRVMLPGEVATQDYREDRLTVRVDHRRTITAVRCG